MIWITDWLVELLTYTLSITRIDQDAPRQRGRKKTHLQLLQNGRSLFNLAALFFNVGQRLSQSRALDLYINLREEETSGSAVIMSVYKQRSFTERQENPPFRQ